MTTSLSEPKLASVSQRVSEVLKIFTPQNLILLPYSLLHKFKISCMQGFFHFFETLLSWVVRELVYANPGFNVDQSTNFSSIKMSFTACVECSLRFIFKFKTEGQTKKQKPQNSGQSWVSLIDVCDTCSNVRKGKRKN